MTNTEMFNLCPPNTPSYNVSTKKCEACPEGEEWVGKTQQCEDKIYTTNPNAPGLIVANSSQVRRQKQLIQKDRPTRTVISCPTEQPYLVGKECHSCASDQLFDLTAQKCVDGCGEGEFYNNRTQKCLKGEVYTDPKANNLVS